LRTPEKEGGRRNEKDRGNKEKKKERNKRAGMKGLLSKYVTTVVRGLPTSLSASTLTIQTASKLKILFDLPFVEEKR